MSSQAIGFGLWAADKLTAGLYISNTIDTYDFEFCIGSCIALRLQVLLGVFGEVSHIDLDLCNDLLHHICRHLWPS